MNLRAQAARRLARRGGDPASQRNWHCAFRQPSIGNSTLSVDGQSHWVDPRGQLPADIRRGTHEGAGMGKGQRNAAANRVSRAPTARVLLLMLALLGCTAAWGYDRDKTDSVTLQNGTYLVGDIVSLEFGILTVKTDNMSTLSIEWPAVRSMTSKFAFAVERRDGSKYFGTIATSADGSQLEVLADSGGISIPVAEVERMSRYSPRFWDRINGSLSLGASYNKSSSIQVGSLNFNSN